jgi:hypothetical protein
MINKVQTNLVDQNVFFVVLVQLIQIL